MKLTELEPQFLRTEMRQDKWTCVDANGMQYEESGLRQYHIYVYSLAEAQGVLFLCPKCFAANAADGKVGVHSVICWFRGRGVPDEVEPKPGRWEVKGGTLEDLTLCPSIALTGDGCHWHGFITAGDVTSC